MKSFLQDFDEYRNVDNFALWTEEVAAPKFYHETASTAYSWCPHLEEDQERREEHEAQTFLEGNKVTST